MTKTCVKFVNGSEILFDILFHFLCISRLVLNSFHSRAEERSEKNQTEYSSREYYL